MKKYVLFAVLTLLLGSAVQVRGETLDGEQRERAPDRIEKKSYTSISEVEMNHKYGGIIVKESNSKNVELEIQYFDRGKQKATCEVSTSNKVLSITTRSSSSKGAKINYILTVPKKTRLITILKYGTMKVDEFSGAFEAHLSYSTMNVDAFRGTKPTIKVKYGNVAIGNAEDMSLTVNYSDIVIKKAKVIEASGNYSNYKVENSQSFITVGGVDYSNVKIATASDVSAVLRYGNLSVDNLISNLSATCAYTDVKIGTTSSKLKNITINGSYADISITVDPSISINFDAKITYGDFIVSKAHTVKYTENSSRASSVVKKGQIGTKNASATIIVTNSYSDVKIK